MALVRLVVADWERSAQRAADRQNRWRRIAALNTISDTALRDGLPGRPPQQVLVSCSELACQAHRSCDHPGKRPTVQLSFNAGVGMKPVG